MKIRPLWDWIVVEPDAAEAKTSGGLFIPESAQEKPEQGRVIAVGEGKFVEEKDKKGKVKEKRFVKTTVQPGDHIVYEKYGARRISVDHQEWVLVREEEVLGCLSAG